MESQKKVADASEQPIVHTPGPWVWKSAVKATTGEHVRDYAFLHPGVLMTSDYGTVSKPDAMAIAACPVMIEALRDAVRLIRHLNGNPSCQIKALEAAGVVV